MSPRCVPPGWKAWCSTCVHRPRSARLWMKYWRGAAPALRAHQQRRLRPTGRVEDLTREGCACSSRPNLSARRNHQSGTAVMRARNEGRIIQISSLLGIVCMGYRGAYNPASSPWRR